MEKINPKTETAEAEKAKFAEVIFQSALAEHEAYRKIPAEELRATIRTILDEMETVENLAGPEKVLEALTPEVAEKIVALWDFSGPGTYDSPTKKDRYQEKTWARGMDRARLNHTAWLARKIAEIRSQNHDKKAVAETKEMISDFGPDIFYNGTAEENSVIKDVLTRVGVMIAADKVHIPDTAIANTVDQVKTFVLPEGLHVFGGEIALVSHAPHLVRTLHMLNRYKVIPEDMKIRLFPLKSPKDSEEYTLMEVRGLLYYIYLSPNKDAVKEPLSYEI